MPQFEVWTPLDWTLDRLRAPWAISGPEMLLKPEVYDAIGSLVRRLSWYVYMAQAPESTGSQLSVWCLRFHLEVCSYRFDSGSEDCITVFSTSCQLPVVCSRY